MMAARFASVEEYIASCDPAVRPLLEDIRRSVREALPGSGEKIAYGIPTVTLHGKSLLTYAAWTSHIGVYPIPMGDEAFASRIGPFRDAKSTARFPLKEAVPVDLIATMAQLLAEERG
jgi:uncharacterized protein YdhG (YjbR/CyaY superfamily)